ncbi:hypothetical protein CY34DRAFT_104368 [Suillus luteus UH-Slu-Lm8-n1]|uniref:Uncharacterized protein n=1 Tax=Suillus luteus UH-Slu-Lm8-n1 TaxID=930992 RepID=A0A0D0BPI8_9AGAM|nr:hypothetical protein CY34DRAFT_104368 [Suillus luteus UH-Slu-Lm8-n1]
MDASFTTPASCEVALIRLLSLVGVNSGGVACQRPPPNCSWSYSRLEKGTASDESMQMGGRGAASNLDAAKRSALSCVMATQHSTFDCERHKSQEHTDKILLQREKWGCEQRNPDMKHKNPRTYLKT